MSLIPFLNKIAIEKGLTVCPNCGEPDIFFALNGKCTNCSNTLPKKCDIKSLQYSLEVLHKFIDEYDEFASREEKKDALLYFEHMISTCKKHSRLPDNEQIILVQSFLNNLDQIGGTRIGGAIYMQNGQPSIKLLSKQAGNTMDNVKSITAVLYSIQYIQNFKVANEFVVRPNQKISPSTVNYFDSKTKNTSKNSGCLSSVFILLLTVLVFFTVIIFT
jgi:hypothetical protein